MDQSFDNSISTKASSKTISNDIICSLKVQKYNLPKDISVIHIFKTLLQEINIQFFKIPKKVNLTFTDIINRKEIILQIKHFIQKYRISQICFYYCVYLIDKLLIKKLKLKIYEIGIGVLLISVKFLEIDGHLPHLYKFQEILKTNQKMSLKRLIEIELICLKALNYDLCIIDPYIFINIILVNGILFNTDSEIGNLNPSIYNYPFKIYDKIITENNDYYQFHPFYLAFACVSFSRKIYQLNYWDIVFTKVFNITFNDIEDVYYFIYDFMKTCKEKENQKQKEFEEKMDNLNINKEISSIEKNKYIKEVKNNNKIELKYSSNTFDVNAHRKLTQQNSKEYLLRSAQKYDSIRNISEVSLKNYINKTKALNLNIDIRELQNIMKSKIERQKGINNSQIINNIYENKPFTYENRIKTFENKTNNNIYEKKNTLYENKNTSYEMKNHIQENKNSTYENINKLTLPKKYIIHSYHNSYNYSNDIINGITVNQSYNNYNNDYKIELPYQHTIKNKEINENIKSNKINENEKTDFLYNSNQNMNLKKLSSGNNLISGIKREKLNILKDSKSPMNNLNNSINNVSSSFNEGNKNINRTNINFNIYNNAFASSQVGSYQIKGIQKDTKKKINISKQSNISSIINNKFKYLFINKK